MAHIGAVSGFKRAVAAIVTPFRRFTKVKVEHWDASREHRCLVAGYQAEKELDQIKSGGRIETYRSGFVR